MDDTNLQTGDFIEYSNWLSRGHRNPSNIVKGTNKILKSNQVTLDPKTNDTKGADPKKEPVVKFEKVDGIIKKMEITCSCGETLRFSLDYDDPNPTKNQNSEESTG